MPPLRFEAGGHAEEQLGRCPDLELFRCRDRPIMRTGSLGWLGRRSVLAVSQCTRGRRIRSAGYRRASASVTVHCRFRQFLSYLLLQLLYVRLLRK